MIQQHFNIGKGAYFGGKSAGGVVHTIINQIPRHKVFVSGFLGRCAVMRWKLPAERNIGFDLDPVVIGKWTRALGDRLELHNEDFLEKIRYWLYPEVMSKDTFLYLDPPYLPETRSSSTRFAFELTIDQHRELLKTVKRMRCMIAISCYDSALYRTELEGWRKIQFPAQTRGGMRTETLYMNYPEPEPHELHDKAFLGRNYRAREKTKRRITTIQSKITRLQPDEKARLSDWLKDLVASQDHAVPAGS